MPSKELVVGQSRHETKVAILEDGQLVEIYFQRENEYSLAGSIHKGRVTRVLPGMQSAFVDLGLERDTFLYVSDFFEEHGEEIEKISTTSPGPERRDRGRDRGRGRDRERFREPQPPPAATSAAPPEVLEPPEVVEPANQIAEAGSSGIPENAETAAPGAETSPAVSQDQHDSRDRRGHRSRRRRNRGRGFPDSKYASAPGALTPDGEEEQAARPPEKEAAEEEFTLLPGESLARYRHPGAGTADPAAGAAGESVEAAAPDGMEDESSETPEADAPAAVQLEVHVSAGELEDLDELEAEAAEQILERVEEELERAALTTLEAEAMAAAGGPLAAASDDLDASEAAAVEDAAPADEDDQEPGEEGAGAAAVAEAGEELLAEATDEATAGAPEGAEPARTPQSLTATLRAQGGRFPHRMGRRSRRRGRGDRPERGDRQPAQTAEAPQEPAAERVEVSQPAPERERPERTSSTSISELLKEGQEIIVQIAKEPLGQKGARITSHIALPGRYVVYMPTVEHLGVSRKIGSDDERQRLKRILTTHRQGIQGGFIMRTAGEGKSESDIASDMNYLAHLWLDIRAKAEKRRAPALLHHDVEIVERLLRDQLTDGFKAIWVDNEDLYEQVLHTMERMQPALLSRVKLYTRSEPIFDAFGISQELEKALRPKVWLKSGGYIVINQTEALVAIDINTGKYVGKSHRLEDTIVKTNTEAVKEIVRQMRLRDLGGIIVIDFIDMEDRKNRQKVMQALEEAMRADKAPYKILQFNDFGLVAITRKRVKQSLERALCSPCPQCEGAGYVKSVQTIIGEILAQAQKYAKVVDTKDCILRVNPEVAKTLKSVENRYLEELEEILKRPVLVTGDPLLHPEKYDLT